MVNATKRVLVVGVAALAVMLWLAGCGSVQEQTIEQKANAEATAIIAQAEATAIVLRAQATARALLSVGSEPEQAPTPAAEDETPAPTAVSELPTEAAEAVEATPEVSGEPAAEPSVTTAGPKVLQVGFGSDGALISVAYKAAPADARKWMLGTVYLTDEKSGTKYGEVPVMPKVGPLLGRPKEYGQVAYIMFVNGPVPLQPGDVVTVVLGDYKQEHVKVR